MAHFTIMGLIKSILDHEFFLYADLNKAHISILNSANFKNLGLPAKF